MRNRAIHFFGGVSMTNGHDGLAEIVGSKVDLDNLKPGEFVAFFNKSFSAMKLLCANGVLIHWRQPSRRKLYSQVVTTLPRFMAGVDVGYSQDVLHAISRYYKKQLRAGGSAARTKLVAA